MEVGEFIKLSFKALKAISSHSTHKVGSGLSFSSKTHEVLESNFGNIQPAQENLRKLKTPQSLFGSRYIVLVPILDVSGRCPESGQTEIFFIDFMSL